MRLGEREGGAQAGGVLKVGEGEGGSADFADGMGIRANGAQEVVLLGEDDGFQVILRKKTTRVEHLDGMDAGQDREQVWQVPMALTKPVKGMGDRNKSALSMEQVDGVLSGEAGRNDVLQKETEELALEGHDLLADDEPAGSQLHCLQGTVEGVVVGDDELVDPLTIASGEEVGDGDEGIFGEAGVDVEVDLDH